ncbi:MAG: hypothetical protein M1826_002202 [Phylliscum demangeonii]|nr:MAG: hypothetical protein M1826_002202 [Phylliscum demangeonii]
MSDGIVADASELRVAAPPVHSPTTSNKAALPSGARPLRFGRKAIYLPNFTLTLLRTPFLPPTFASFIVPLNFNKLDLKDYLYHAYDVRVLAVRSFVQQQRVRQDRPNAIMPVPNRWFRPRAIKKMTVEMDRGFRWPDEPTDFTPWDKRTYEIVEKEQEKEKESRSADGGQQPTRERESMAEQARRLLRGDDRWKVPWEDVGEPVEVVDGDEGFDGGAEGDGGDGEEEEEEEEDDDDDGGEDEDRERRQQRRRR